MALGVPVVHFVSGVSDPLDWAQRAVQRAHGKGLRLWVVGSAPDLLALERRICAAEIPGFVPIAGAGASAAVRQRSVLQMHGVLQDLPTPPLGTRLVNLAAQLVRPIMDFEEVLDCAGVDAEALDAGRRRFRAYQAEGLEVRHTTSRSALT